MSDIDNNLPPAPAPEPVKASNIGNMVVGCLNGVGIMVGAFILFLGVVSPEPMATVIGGAIAIGLTIVMVNQHRKGAPGYLVGALIFIGFTLLLFGICVAMLTNMNFN